jgi:hypothetical protein
MILSYEHGILLNVEKCNTRNTNHNIRKLDAFIEIKDLEKDGYVLKDLDVVNINNHNLLETCDDCFASFCYQCQHDINYLDDYWYYDTKILCSSCEPHKCHSAKTWWDNTFPRIGSLDDWITIYSTNDSCLIVYNSNTNSILYGKLGILKGDDHARVGFFTFEEEPNEIINQIESAGSTTSFLESRNLETEYG